jgi:hypothetical protein
MLESCESSIDKVNYQTGYKSKVYKNIQKIETMTILALGVLERDSCCKINAPERNENQE